MPPRSRPVVSVGVDGMEGFRRGVRTLGKDAGKELGKANKDVGTAVRQLADLKVSAMTGRYPAYGARVVRIAASANQRHVQVTVRPGAVEAGADRHPVYGRWQAQNEFRRRVWPPALRKGDGYVVRPAVEDNEQQIGDLYVQVITDLAERLLPGTSVT